MASSCVDVRIGSDRFYDCVNHDLRGMVPKRRFSAEDLPYPADAPPTVLNLFNQAATRQRLGTAFGHSAYPQRGPAPVLVPPSLGR